MRDFLDAILAFIVSESMTDLEYTTIMSTMPLYDQTSYDDLSRILVGRGAISTIQERLVSYYSAKGVSVVAAKTGITDIFIGEAL